MARAPGHRASVARRPASQPTVALAALLVLEASCISGQLGSAGDCAGASCGETGGDAGADRSAADGTIRGDQAPADAGGSPGDGGAAAAGQLAGLDAARPSGPLFAFSVPSRIFTETFYLRLTTATPGVRLFLTTDGSLPIETTAPHVGPVRVDHSTLVRVLAIDGRFREVATAIYLQTSPELASFGAPLPMVLLHSLAGNEPPVDRHDNSPGALLITRPEGGLARTSGPVDLAARVGWRVRGRTSRDAEQRSYGVELWDVQDGDDLNLPVLGLPAQSDWVLHGSFKVDPSLIRNALMYAVSNRIGRYAPRTRFVEVFVESAGRPLSPASYRGVYTLVEKVKRDPLRVNIAALQPGDASGPRLTGGYIFKVDDNFAPGDMGLTAGGERVELEEPGRLEISPAQRAYLASYLDQLAVALATPGGRHPTSGLHYQDYIDVDSWIDFHILNVFARNPDALRLSAYYFKDRGGKLQAGPLWDLDRSMGANDYRDPSPEGWSASHDGTKVFEHGWWRFLFQDPSFEDRYWKRWEALLATELRSERLIPLVTALAAEVAPAQPRHAARWPTVAPMGGYAAEITRLTGWIQARLVWIQANLRRR